MHLRERHEAQVDEVEASGSHWIMGHGWFSFPNTMDLGFLLRDAHLSLNMVSPGFLLTWYARSPAFLWEHFEVHVFYY